MSIMAKIRAADLPKLREIIITVLGIVFFVISQVRACYQAEDDALIINASAQIIDTRTQETHNVIHAYQLVIAEQAKYCQPEG